MAIVKTGNALTSKFVQPGSTYEIDGYGLLTARAIYLLDKSVGGTAVAGGQCSIKNRHVIQLPVQLRDRVQIPPYTENQRVSRCCCSNIIIGSPCLLHTIAPNPRA